MLSETDEEPGGGPVVDRPGRDHGRLPTPSRSTWACWRQQGLERCHQGPQGPPNALKVDIPNPGPSRVSREAGSRVTTGAPPPPTPTASDLGPKAGRMSPGSASPASPGNPSLPPRAACLLVSMGISVEASENHDVRRPPR